MGSKRLPGKMMMDLAGEPLVLRVLQRLSRASLVDEVALATSTLADDDPLESVAKEAGFACYRGSEIDVLGRYLEASRAHTADLVVRVTGDCPLIDASVVDDV